MNQCCCHHLAIAFALLDGNHSLGAPTMSRVFGNGRALAETLLGGRQHALFAILGNQHGNDTLAFLQIHPPDTPRIAAHRADVVFVKPNCFAAIAEQHHVMLSIGQCSTDQVVSFIQCHRNNPALAGIVEVVQRRFLDSSLGRGHEHILVRRKAALFPRQCQHHRDFFSLLEREHVDNRPAARAARACRHLPDLQPVEPAPVGKAQDVVMRVGNEQLVYPVVFLGRGGLLATTTTLLRPVFRQRLTLDIAGV